MIGWLKSLLKDSLVYGIGFGVSRFLQVLVLPIIARSLSLSEYGYYSNYVIFYTIAGGIFVLGLDGSVARFFYDSDEKNYHRKIFSISFFCILLTSVICVSAFSFFPESLLKIINVPAAYNAALPYVLYTIPSLVLNNFLLSWFKWRRQRTYFLINSIGSVLLLLIPLLLIRPISFLFVFKIIFFSQVTIAFISLLLSSNYIKIIFDKPLFFAMLKYGFPWMLVFFLGLSRSYLDRFFLTHYLSDDAYGVYNFSVRISTLLSLVLTAFDMSFMPLAFSIWNKEGSAIFFAKLQSAYTFLISSTACFIAIISPVIIKILGGIKYQGSEKILPFLLFSAIPLSLINFSSLGTLYAKKSFLNTATLLIGFSVVLLLNIILTPIYFQYGAVNASIIGHVLITASGYYFSQRYYKIPFKFVKDGLIFIFFLLLSILSVQLSFSANIYQDIAYKLVCLSIIGGIIFISLFKSEYKKILSLIKNLRYVSVSGNAGL